MLIDACRSGCVNIVRWLVEDVGCDVKADRDEVCIDAHRAGD